MGTKYSGSSFGVVFVRGTCIVSSHRAAPSPSSAAGAAAGAQRCARRRQAMVSCSSWQKQSDYACRWPQHDVQLQRRGP